MGVLVMRALLSGVHIRAPDCLKLPGQDFIQFHTTSQTALGVSQRYGCWGSLEGKCRTAMQAGMARMAQEARILPGS